MPRVRPAVKPPGGPATVPPPAPNPTGVSSMSVKRPPARRASSAAPAVPPTPPRTTHKRKRRSRSRVTDSSSEDEDVRDVPEPESDEEGGRGKRKAGTMLIGHKKRRTLTLDAIAEELSETRAEEIFWTGEAAATSSTAADNNSGQPTHLVAKNRAPTRTRSRTRSPSSSPPPAPHLLRRGHTGLFSPPPSRRAPVVVPRPATPPPLPRPSGEKGKTKGGPERDSPNNPFLDDSPGSVPASEELSSPEPRTPRKHAEKPTMGYVYRGMKVVGMNPHYLPKEVEEVIEAHARLPIGHPEFSPSEAAPPKLLFPEARKHDRARRRAHSPGLGSRRAHLSVPFPTSPTPTTTGRRAGSASSDEECSVSALGAPGPSTIVEEGAEDIDAMASAMAARIARRMHKGVLADGDEPRTRPNSRLGESPRLPEKDRGDPIKRAFGPVRPE